MTRLREGPISEPEVSELGNRVAAARKRLGWSREALAFHSGISWSGIAQVESGRRRNLRPDTLSGLARALGVTIDYLVGGGPATAVMLDHAALFYGADDELVQTAGPFLEEGVERSEAVLVLETKENIKLLRKQLGPAAGRVDFVESATWLTTPASAMESITGYARDKLEGGAPWIRFLGEPIWKGRAEAEILTWTRFESLVNLVFAAWPMNIICPYDERSTSPEVATQARATHPHTIAHEGTFASPDYPGPGAVILDSGA